MLDNPDGTTTASDTVSGHKSNRVIIADFTNKQDSENSFEEEPENGADFLKMQMRRHKEDMAEYMKQLNWVYVYGKKYEFLPKQDSIFQLVKGLSAPNIQQSLCNVCEKKEVSMNHCTFCGHRTCKECLAKKREYPNQPTLVNADSKNKKIKGPICKICDRKYIMRDWQEDRVRQVTRAEEEMMHFEELSRMKILELETFQKENQDFKSNIALLDEKMARTVEKKEAQNEEIKDVGEAALMFVEKLKAKIDQMRQECDKAKAKKKTEEGKVTALERDLERLKEDQDNKQKEKEYLNQLMKLYAADPINMRAPMTPQKATEVRFEDTSPLKYSQPPTPKEKQEVGKKKKDDTRVQSMQIESKPVIMDFTQEETIVNKTNHYDESMHKEYERHRHSSTRRRSQISQQDKMNSKGCCSTEQKCVIF